MAKQQSEAEKQVVEAAKAFKDRLKLGDWGQDTHALFIAQVAHDCGMDKAALPAFHAKLKMMGLGGNCSQFAQACGFRKPKEAASGSDVLAQLGLS